MAKYTSTVANDTFTGALGNDIAVFHGDLSGYFLDVSNDIFTVADTVAGDTGGDDGMDSLSGIEKLIFTGNNKQLLMSQEAIVNIGTAGDQTETAMLAKNGGGFYSFWQSSGDPSITDGDDGKGYYFRTFGADGVGTGADVRLLSDVATGVKQAVFSDNSFVLVWTESDSSGSGVYTQKFDSTGKALNDKFRVNDTITDDQASPSVAVTTSGGYVVAWASANQGDSLNDGIPMGDTPNQTGVFAQLFDANSNPLGWETKVSPSGGGTPTVAATQDGGFVVSYEAIVGSAKLMKVFADLFDSDGNRVTPLIDADDIYVNQIVEIDTGPATNELRTETKLPVITQLTGGDILVVWQSPVDTYGVTAGIDYDRSIMYRMYDSSGFAINLPGSNNIEIKANTDNGFDFGTGNNVARYEQSDPAVAALAGGGFVIAWQSMLQDQSYWGVYAQMFNSDGSKNGSEFLVNTKTADSQKNPSVTGLSDGSFVISWEAEHQDGIQQGLFQEGTAGTEIVMQRYDASGNKLGASFAGTASADNLKITGTDAVELDGAAGNDVLSTSSGNDTIRGGLGDDSISGASGNDILIGGDGKDTIVGGVGNDTVFGGDGSDRFVLTGNYDDYTIIGGNGTYTITDERVSGIVDGVDVVSGIEVLGFADKDFSIGSSTSGGTTGEMLTGSITVADTLNGGDNNDTLQGGGNNVGIAVDTLQGGNGDDTYIITGTAAVIFDTAGTDTLQIATTIDLNKQTIGKLDGLQYIENVILLGAKSLKLTGNADDNELTGNNGANNIKGSTGDDTINGGLGKDVLTGGDGDDVFIFDATPSKANVDKIMDFGNGSDSIQLADAFFSNLDPDGDGAITYIEGSGLKAAANDLVSYIVYDTKGGGIYYDAAGAKAILFATLGKVGGHIPDLDASDFSLI